MTTWRNIARTIEGVAPLVLQEDYDNSGLQAESAAEVEVTDLLITLDVTEEVVAEAVRLGAQMVVSHHPLLFRPLRRVTTSDYVSRTLRAALRADITLYAAHTNLDNAPRGVNARLASVLGLSDVRPLLPLPADKLQRSGLTAEEQAGAGSGMVGLLPEAMSAEDFVRYVKERLHAPAVKYNVDGPQTIRRVALCGGAGGSFISAAVRSDADAYLTGEVGYHPFFGHPELLILEAGHFETEQYTAQLLRELIEAAHPGVRCHLSEHLMAPTRTL
jgi:dinuclear metal center YbgI/SA1388 family protein